MELGYMYPRGLSGPSAMSPSIRNIRRDAYYDGYTILIVLNKHFNSYGRFI